MKPPTQISPTNPCGYIVKVQHELYGSAFICKKQGKALDDTRAVQYSLHRHADCSSEVDPCFVVRHFARCGTLLWPDCGDLMPNLCPLHPTELWLPLLCYKLISVAPHTVSEVMLMDKSPHQKQSPIRCRDTQSYVTIRCNGSTPPNRAEKTYSCSRATHKEFSVIIFLDFATCHKR